MTHLIRDPLRGYAKLKATLAAKDGEHVHLCEGLGCQGEWWIHGDDVCQDVEIKDCPLCDGQVNGDMEQGGEG
jgi:hypothetical protein